MLTQVVLQILLGGQRVDIVRLGGGLHLLFQLLGILSARQVANLILVVIVVCLRIVTVCSHLCLYTLCLRG